MDRLTLFGLFAVTAMLVTYALEKRSPWFILAFIAVITVHPFLQLSANAHANLIRADQLMLTMAMFALGMQMQIPALIKGSRRTPGLGAILWGWLTLCAALIATS